MDIGKDGKVMIKVAIPVYNAEQYLRRCVDSVLAQTEKEYYIVLVDDGSKDNSGKICDEYAEKYENVFVIHHLTNQGVSAARNSALNFSRECDYISFVDSDDKVHSLYLKLLLQTLQREKCKMSICGHRKVLRGLQRNQRQSYTKSVLTAEECYCSKQFSTTPLWGKLFQSELFDSIRFPMDKIYEDYYTTWKIMFQLDKVAVTSRVLYYYMINPKGIMRSSWTPRQMDVFEALNEKLSFFRENSFVFAEQRAIEKCTIIIDSYIKAITGTKYEKEYLQILLKMKKYYIENNFHPTRCETDCR